MYGIYGIFSRAVLVLQINMALQNMWVLLAMHPCCCEPNSTAGKALISRRECLQQNCAHETIMSKICINYDGFCTMYYVCDIEDRVMRSARTTTQMGCPVLALLLLSAPLLLAPIVS